MAVIPEDGRIGVLTSNRLNIYDKDGNCLVTVSGAPPVNGSTPWGLAYHPTSGKFLITRVADHSVWSIDPDGTNATQIYVSATFINTPRAIDADDDGYIYVSSSGSDTIEKLYYDGTGVATRALTAPLIGPNVFTQNVQQISVMRREP
jgi:DNA-binding beta-propeller fold protein YncE